MMELNCPKCHRECDGEAPKKPWFYHFECECGFEFVYDSYRDEYYDMNGNVIKEVEMVKSKIVKYELSKDKVGLLAHYETGEYYHIHSDEMTQLEKWIHKLLLEIILLSKEK